MASGLKLRRGMATIGTRENESEAGKSRADRMSGFRWIALLFFISFATSVWGQAEQTQDSKITDPAQGDNKGSSTKKNADARPASDSPGPLLKNLVHDQEDIWTSPFRLKPGDLKWAVPFAGITTGLIMTDRTASHEASRRYVTGRKTPDGSPNCWHTGVLRPSAPRVSPANSTFPRTSSLEALSAISSGSMFIAPITIRNSMAQIMGLSQRNRSSFGLTVPVQRTWNWIAGFTPRWNA